ncbi:late competence development protein ComFB [Gottschalkia purinilytica]|uniref:Late competence development protein ComFB n=1 Tax=Gottschalkia purinilytica TaxID=1503 RepID=A0A0L0WEB5_GOTPU|nr:late competence development ComFB family protein [Gottschalkia purinilytica]KNF09809.1 late competence development protein ComFB [Gottschalkia purinilytica]
MILNYMEVLVKDILNELKYSHNMSESNDEKLQNIQIIALNNLPPMYFSSNVSEAEKKAFLLDRQRRITVLAKVAEAIDVVCNNNS